MNIQLSKQLLDAIIDAYNKEKPFKYDSIVF